MQSYFGNIFLEKSLGTEWDETPTNFVRELLAPSPYTHFYVEVMIEFPELGGTDSAVFNIVE
jgi:hypothetical protein